MTTRAIVSLGSNIEPRATRLAAAVAELAELPRTRLAKLSGVYDTEPVGVPEAYREMRFLNQIAVVDTELGLEEFFRGLQRIEKDLGRERGPERNAPRTIDLDLIAFGDEVAESEELTVPHPRAREREFVTTPLEEVMPGYKWPAKKGE